jgi:hypothetical protein
METAMYKILIPIILLASAPARADGYEGSAKDAPSAYSYSYSIKQSRGGWECPREFDRRECRRIQAEVSRRRAREQRVVRYAEPRRYPAIRETIIRPARAEFGGKRCIGRVTITGGQRPTEGLARGAAWKEWRSVVRAMAGGGEAYMDSRYSVGERVRCHITGANGFLKRCEISAIPCR